MVDTEPYPWPWDGRFTPARLALVIAGAQPSLVVRTRGASDVMECLLQTAAAVRASAGLVVWLRRGEELAVDIATDDIVIDSTGVDGFHGSGLDEVLRRTHRDLLAMAGLGLETTVHSTLRSANDRGYECLTLTDATAPHDLSLQPAALSSICMSGGIFGAIGTSRALVDALTEPS